MFLTVLLCENQTIASPFEKDFCYKVEINFFLNGSKITHSIVVIFEVRIMFLLALLGYISQKNSHDLLMCFNLLFGKQWIRIAMITTKLYEDVRN